GRCLGTASCCCPTGLEFEIEKPLEAKSNLNCSISILHRARAVAGLSLSQSILVPLNKPSIVWAALVFLTLSQEDDIDRQFTIDGFEGFKCVQELNIGCFPSFGSRRLDNFAIGAGFLDFGRKRVHAPSLQ